MELGPACGEHYGGYTQADTDPGDSELFEVHLNRLVKSNSAGIFINKTHQNWGKGGGEENRERREWGI